MNLAYVFASPSAEPREFQDIVPGIHFYGIEIIEQPLTHLK